jgi:hypothetical protein
MPTKKLNYFSLLLSAGINLQVIKKSLNSKNQGFSSFFCLLMEVSGPVQIITDPDPGGPITYGPDDSRTPTEKAPTSPPPPEGSTHLLTDIFYLVKERSRDCPAIFVERRLDCSRLPSRSRQKGTI